jgi:hypothetical protein
VLGVNAFYRTPTLSMCQWLGIRVGFGLSVARTDRRSGFFRSVIAEKRLPSLGCIDIHKRIEPWVEVTRLALRNPSD